MAGCSGTVDDKTGTDGLAPTDAVDSTTDPPPYTPPTDTTPPTDSATDTDTGAIDPCGASATLTVDVTVVDGRLQNDRELDVTVEPAAPVAALCTSDADPSEQHLVESAEVATSHALRLQGLLPETDYTCQVAATCPTLASGPIAVPVTTGERPDLPVLSVDVDPALGMTGYWTLLTYMSGACSYGTRWLVLYDGDGVARWWYTLPNAMWIDAEALYDPADNSIVWGGGDATAGRARVVDVWAGDTYLTNFAGWQDLVYSHDAKRTPDGQILTLDYRETTDGSAVWGGFGIRQHDPVTLDVTWDLSSQRYFDEGWLRAGTNQPYSDPYHANWFEVVEDAALGDRVYLSLCEDWSLMSFDKATGDVRWKFGRGEGWTLQDAAGNALGDAEFPQCTHGDEVVGYDQLLLYDNGQGRPFSRIVQWTIDAANHSATLDWEWGEAGWHEDTLGDVDVLDNGRLLVTEAHPECWSVSPGARSQIVEVDPTSGAVASRMTFPRTADTTYRAERYDGCTMMSSVRACSALADRAAELALSVGW